MAGGLIERFREHRRRRRVLGAHDGHWMVCERPIDEATTCIVRADLRFRDDATTRAAFPIRVGITLPHDAAFTTEDSDRYYRIEDDVIVRNDGRAVHVASIFSRDFRELVLYATSEGWVPGYHDELRQALAPIDVQMYATGDPEWTVYAELIADR